VNSKLDDERFVVFYLVSVVRPMVEGFISPVCVGWLGAGARRTVAGEFACLFGIRKGCLVVFLYSSRCWSCDVFVV
jgi:hypothetical protein